MSRSGPRQPMGRARRVPAKHPSHAAAVSVAMSAQRLAIRGCLTLVFSQESDSTNSQSVTLLQSTVEVQLYPQAVGLSLHSPPSTL